ncbi:PKD domain-containing protein [uncultured Cyclobacterium sp.]|uniref:PKD domain-containing protein n=1 Tax=uncultured Cyclobacterium sp. TaxID=453820 RepID=UPI0030EBBAEA
MIVFTKSILKRIKEFGKIIFPGIVVALLISYQVFETKGEIFTIFAPVTITGQTDQQVHYKGDLVLSLDMLTIDYSGDKSNLNLEILAGEGYTFTGQTISTSIVYDDTWEAKGQEITVNVQVSDGVDVSPIFPMTVLVIPPILPLNYFENSCLGTITLTVSAYKPDQRHEESFPFTFQLVDETDNIISEITVDNTAPFQSSASVVFGLDNDLDREAQYKIIAVDNIGREYFRNAGPLGQAYSLDFELNFAGYLCPDDDTGVVEFIIFNAALPVSNFVIIDSNGNETPTNFHVVSDDDGFAVIQVQNLEVGAYTLEIEDRFQCNGRESFEIIIPEPIEITETVEHLACYGDMDGEISLFISGGWSQPFAGNPRENWIKYGVTWFDEGGEEVEGDINTFVSEGGEIIGMESKLENLPAGAYYAKITDRGRLFDIAGADPLVCELTTSWITVEGPDALLLSETIQDITCNGADDGSIAINPSGGVPGYTIAWYTGNFDNLSTPNSNDLDVLPPSSEDDVFTRQQLKPGDYAVLLTDENGCIVAENFTISEPTPLTLTERSDLREDVRCFGEETGTIAIELHENTPTPFSIEVFLDGDLVEVLGPINTIPSGPLLFTELEGGTYDFRIEDKNGCNYLLEGILVDEPPTGLLIEDIVVSDFNGFQISCSGIADGSISLDISGGLGALDYFWTGPNGFESTSKDINNLEPGEYQFIVTDENICTASIASIVLEEPDPLLLNENIPESNGFQISCFGASDASIDLNPSGGTGNYTYSWSGPDSFSAFESSIQNLSAGTYSLELTDENGCLIERTYEITEPNELIVSEDLPSKVPVACFGESNGAFTINIDQSSLPPYAITLEPMDESTTILSISNFTGESYSFVNLPGNLYKVTVEDANGCVTILDNILVDQPASGLQLTALQLSDFNDYEISCAGESDGSISFNITGNQGVLSYNWTGPNGFISEEANLVGLEAGIYELVVADESGCTLSRQFVIEEPDPLTLIDEVSDYNGFGVQCNGGNEGYIYLDISGGSGGTTIEWTGPDGFVSQSENLDNLFPGTYNVVITDLNGCQINKTYTLTEPQGLEIAELAGEKVNVFCFGQATGVLAAVINRTSAGPYIYTLMNEGGDVVSTSPPTSETTWNFTGLIAGRYSFTVSDVNDCLQEIENLEITQPASGLQIEEVSVSNFTGFNSSCFGADNAWIKVTTSGGSGNYHYEWSGPDNFIGNKPSIENLKPGDYQLTITDQNGCEVTTDVINIIEPDPLLANSIVSSNNGYEISCNGADDGSIELNPSGGTGNYTLSWTGPNGFTSDALTVSNLAPGNYEVTIIDENNCEVIEEFSIEEPEPLTLRLVEKVAVLCYGEATGSISISVEGGILDSYSYNWTRDGLPIALNTANINGLLSGLYSVVVTDANGCQIERSNIEVSQPVAPLEVTMKNTEVSCYNANDADLSIDIQGGVAPYNISWNIGSTQSSFIGIGPGFYQVTVTDANGCSVIKETTIAEVPVFEIAPVVNPISCFGAMDGSILLNLNGGAAPVKATWAHGPEQSSLYNLAPGIYSVYLEDAKGCTIERTFNLLEPELLIASGQVEDALVCQDGNSGAINLTVSGGRPPYNYNWSTGETSPSIFNLTNGTYSVEVSDQSGCYVRQTFEVKRPDPIVINVATTTSTQCEPREILETIDLNIDGGVAPYSIDWSSGEVSNNGYRMETNTPGNYQVTVTDGFGCVQTKSFVVENNIVLAEGDYLSASYPTYGENLVNFEVQFINKSSGNISFYYWDFGDGNNSLEENPTFSYQVPGTYTVTLMVTDTWGCETYDTFEIVITDYFLKTPNVFTPNNDGINDTYFPKFVHVESLAFTIMDKWGEILFHSEDLNDTGWDGSYRGQKASPGNYIYKLNYTTTDGRNFSETGAFMLLE